MTAPPTYRNPSPSVPLTILASERVFANLQRMAREAGRTPAQQAQMLFDAAYSARCKPTGDKALDRAVATMEDARPAEPDEVILPPVPLTPATIPVVIKPVLTARQAAHAAIVARAKAAVPGDLGGRRMPPEPPTPWKLPAEPEPVFVGIDPVAPVETMGGGMSEPAAPDITQPEDGHAGTTECAMASAPAAPPAAGEAAEAGEVVRPAEGAEGPDAPAVEGGEPPVPEARGAPESDAAPAPEAVTISAATLKYMRTLKSIGNDAAEIADMTGLPVQAVREALAGRM